MKKGVQTAICCPCGKEKILALGLCATCYMLKRQDAEYFGGPREQVLERDWVNAFAGSRDYKCYNQIEVDGPEIPGPQTATDSRQSDLL